MTDNSSKNKDSFKVKSGNWTEAKFRIRNICDKHEIPGMISHVAADRFATVVHPADLDDFADNVGRTMVIPDTI